MRHSNIQQVFDNIFMVTGSNITVFGGIELQHSRNMIILRHNKKLSLINTVRLSEDGLTALDALGEVTNIIRIGAFHGRDDAFYTERYQASYWALPGMPDKNSPQVARELIQLPIAGLSIHTFEVSNFPEAVMHLDIEGGILITCDSIKNWVAADEYFSGETATRYQQQGFFGTASVSDIWLQACGLTLEDLKRLLEYQFKHLLSAHGKPLLNTAREALKNTLGD